MNVKWNKTQISRVGKESLIGCPILIETTFGQWEDLSDARDIELIHGNASMNRRRKSNEDFGKMRSVPL